MGISTSLRSQVSKEREMERDNGLGANLGSARHDVVSELMRRRETKDVISDKSIKSDPNAPRIITSR